MLLKMMPYKQFRIYLSFAVTINKTQGQTFSNVNIFLSEHVKSQIMICYFITQCYAIANKSFGIRNATSKELSIHVVDMQSTKLVVSFIN